MKKLQPRKLLLLIAIACMCGSASFAQVTYTQGFEGTTFVPTGWTLSTSTGFGLWSRRTTGTFPTCTPHGGTAMARFNSHTGTAGRTQAIITPVIDYSALGGNTATFSLWIYRDTGVATVGDSLTILVNTAANDTGATRLGAIARSVSINLPDVQAASGWYQYSFNVPTSFNTNTNYIIINGTAQAGNNIYIDDVEWVAYPPLCSGLPSVGTVVSTPAQICGGGGTAALTLGGATAGYGGLTYQWQTATAGTGPWATFDSVAATTSGNITTTNYYRCIISCTNSGLSDTSAVYTLVVSTSTAPIITVAPNNPAYCAGGTAATITASGAANYVWSPSAGLNTTTDSTVLASPTATTQYLVTGTDTAGCSGTATVTVFVRQPPVLTISAVGDTVCGGDSATLTVTATGAPPTFLWTPDSLTSATIKVSPATSTVYTVVTAGAGCPGHDSIEVYAGTSTAAFGYSANGLAVSFNNTSTNAAAYLWVFGDGTTDSLQNPVHTYSQAGTDTVMLVTTGYCGQLDTVVQVIMVTTGIKGVAGNVAVSVYPNPAGNYALVQFNMNEPQAQLSLINSLGELVAAYQIAATNGTAYQQQMDLSALAAGVYLLRITTATQIATRQFVKQ